VRQASRLRRWGAAALGIVAVSLIGFGPAPAGADAVGDKRAQAEQIADRIDELNNQIEILAEQYNAANIELDRIQGEVADARAKVDEAKAEQALRLDQLRQFAIQAYVSGGGTDPLPVLLESEDGNAVGQRTGYLKAAVGDREQLIDQLKATQEDLSSKIAELDAAEAEQQKVTDTLAAKKSAADKAVTAQKALLAQAQGELAQLVAAAQAAKAASSAAKPPASTGGGSSLGPPPPVSGGVAGVIEVAKAQLGKPYVWGAAGPNSFDCSGFTLYVWKNGAGVSLPHNSAAQYNVTTHISMSSIQPGDLVFYGSPIHHVALYVGNGQIIHAPHSGGVVEYDSVYYWDALVGAGRV